MNRLITGVMTLIALILIWIASTVLIVDQRTYAIVSTLGKAQPRLIHTPGLYFKWPFPFAQVLTLDKRLRARCADQKEMGIQWGIQWRIMEPRLYIRRFGNDLRRAELQLSEYADAAA